jgi:hypothetical protein
MIHPPEKEDLSMLEANMFRIICGVLAAALLALIVMRRRSRANVD